MKKSILFAMSLLFCSCGTTPPPEPVAPVAEVPQRLQPAAHPDNHPGDDADVLWGVTVPDPYRWLEDASQPTVQKWMKAQDTRARDYLNKLDTRADFEKKLSDLLYVPSISTPVVRHGMALYFERGPKDEKSILYARNLEQPDLDPWVILDPNKLSEDGSVSIGGIYPSPNMRYVAYTLKKNNADKAEVHIYDMHDGRTIDDLIEGGRYADPEWLEDGSGFYYTWFPTDEAIPVDERPGMTEIRFHRVGTPESDDTTIIPALHDPTKFHSPFLADRGKWLGYIINDGWNGNSLQLRLEKKPKDKWMELPTKPDTSYMPIIHDDELFMLTNDGAPRFKIVRVSLKGKKVSLAADKWVDLVPEFEDRVIQDMGIVGGKLFVVTLKDVVNALEVYDLDGNHLKTVELPDRGTLGSLSGRPDDRDVYFKFTSFRLPASVYKLDTETLDLSMWAEIKTPAHTGDIVSEQLFATSKDGTKVPMFVLRHKDTPLDGTARTMIYGYGGFTYSITPTFNPAVYAWLEAGGIYVYSNLRGGSEYGEEWHQAGMRLKKQNVFDDYYAVAQYLIDHKYTRTESLAAYGGSNGGLLTGAALTQQPHLYGAIVCAVPLLDMIRYQKFGSGRTWIAEYGNAEDSEEEFRAIYAYSPYANVIKTDYPAVLFLGADSDDRVDPMHARKMTAAIQDATTSDRPVLLRIEKNSGHGGADLTRQRIAQFADIYAFLWEVLQ